MWSAKIELLETHLIFFLGSLAGTQLKFNRYLQGNMINFMVLSMNIYEFLIELLPMISSNFIQTWLVLLNKLNLCPHQLYF